MISPHTNIFVSLIEDINFPSDIFSSLSYFDKSFYFEQPDKDVLFCGLGSVHGITSDFPGFSSVKDQCEMIKLNFKNDLLNSLDFPVVLGGMKFPGENKNLPDEWNDYKSSDWFIPKYLLMKKEGRNYFLSFSKEPLNAGSAYDEFASECLCDKNSPNIKPEGLLVKNILKYKWHLMVENAVAEIRKGHISKIVLSRKVDLELNEDPDFNYIMTSLRERYSSCTLFIYKSNESYFFGATPEKAVSVKNGVAEFDALAGSAPRGVDRLTDSRYEKYLLNSIKDRDEHNYVIDYIKNESSSLVKDFTISETIVKKLNNIQHLFTGITAEIKEPSFVFPLLDKVIPTPAVCGLPKDASLKFINENENYVRGLYAGTIGWFNLKYEGEFMAALRSALYKNNKLSIFAGCGIVEDSDPAKEYEETELKLQPIMSIFL